MAFFASAEALNRDAALSWTFTASSPYTIAVIVPPEPPEPLPDPQAVRPAAEIKVVAPAPRNQRLL
ncbi:hypothetical protein GCM10010512_26810 [Streptomyces thermoviolaceus subsp. thermoviolaceus]|nr:hypothetical protein GCM10010499_29620 [Streptomyces thermoviolaceus subsp. apingens]GHA93948.1 hypothetical protein GCM10010512_26810 [Streptomyces thermoviolaceus subsp. thermoviolaceus]